MTKETTNIKIENYKVIQKIGFHLFCGAFFCFSIYVCAAVAISYLLPIDDSDVSRFDRSGFKIHTDNKTKLQYISKGGCLTPRLDVDGNHLIKIINKK